MLLLCEFDSRHKLLNIRELQLDNETQELPNTSKRVILIKYSRCVVLIMVYCLGDLKT